MPYFVAGYPSLAKTREFLWEAAEAGADLIELGIPFSDPVADGPTLQRAIRHALDRGVTVRKSLDLVRGLLREAYPIPILGMTYANLLASPGYEQAASAWSASGLSGAIVPDVPWEEAGALRSSLRSNGMGTVSFASPSTATNRLRSVVRSSDGFVYLVAVYGTTGTREGVAPETRELLRRARRLRGRSQTPLCVGFGVSRPSHVEALGALGADGVVVGSAIAQRIRDGARVGRFISSLRRAAQARD